MATNFVVSLRVTNYEGQLEVHPHIALVGNPHLVATLILVRY